MKSAYIKPPKQWWLGRHIRYERVVFRRVVGQATFRSIYIFGLDLAWERHSVFGLIWIRLMLGRKIYRRNFL